MLLLGDHGLIGAPEITVAVPSAIGCWYGLPQAATHGLAAVANHIRHYLPAPATQRDPDPRCLGLVQHKRPQFIQFECGGLWHSRIWLEKRATHWRERS